MCSGGIWESWVSRGVGLMEVGRGAKKRPEIHLGNYNTPLLLPRPGFLVQPHRLSVTPDLSIEHTGCGTVLQSPGWSGPS